MRMMPAAFLSYRQQRRILFPVHPIQQCAVFLKWNDPIRSSIQHYHRNAIYSQYWKRIQRMLSICQHLDPAQSERLQAFGQNRFILFCTSHPY